MSFIKKEDKNLKLVKELTLKLIVYSPEELKEMLENVGFKILFAFKDKGIYDIKDRIGKEIDAKRIIWVCYK